MRPFCIATIGGILGIIVGLYFKSIALLVILFILTTLVILLLKNISKEKIRMIIIFLIGFVLLESLTIWQENNFEQINKKYAQKEIEIQAIVINDKIEKEYKDVYYVQVIKVEGQDKKQNFKMVLNVKRQKEHKLTLEYGDIICFKGIYEQPNEARNEGGFDYAQYLKTKKIVGITTIKAEEINVIDKNRTGMLARVVHDIRRNIVTRIRAILTEDIANLCTGLLVGEKSELSEDIQETFRKSNLSHMLAISGAHISYILLGITTLIQRLKFHKRWSKVILIFFFIFFMALTGFTASVTRSCIMVILQLLASILFRKSDVYQNLAISSFIILLINPYTLLDIGFQLSFGGTIGIIIFSKKLQKSGKQKKRIYMNKLLEIVEKSWQKIKEMCIVTLSANLIIIPIMVYHFNTISFTFFISNLLASPILGISLILGMILILSLLIVPLAKILSLFLQPILQLLIWIAEFSSRLPLSQILVPTPKIWQISLYYFILICIFFYKSNLQDKYKFITKYKKGIIVILIFLMFFPYIFQIIPNDKLVISFIDVGQGDSMLIQTPSRKTILVDGGGSETGSFDVGEKTLIPYLLDKGIMKIDYMMFSHFDRRPLSRLIKCYGKIECEKGDC